jgi:hypothetical protein
MHERVNTLIKLYYKALYPINCITRTLFQELDLGIVKQNPWYKSELREHNGSADIMCIDYSSRIQLLDCCENKDITHSNFLPGADYFIRTIFFKHGKVIVRLYCNQNWKYNRRIIDLSDFIIQIHIQDGYAIDCFEKIVFGVI